MKKFLVIVMVLALATVVFGAQDDKADKEKKNIPNGQGEGLIKNGTIEPTPVPTATATAQTAEEIEIPVEEIIRDGATPTPTPEGGRTVGAGQVIEIIE
jgi:hypothetical protein